MSFGEKLRNLRIKNKLTQKELAEKLMTTNTSISNWEKGLSKPSKNIVALISEVLNVPPFELIGDYDLNDIEKLKEKNKKDLSYEDVLALEFSKNKIKNFTIIKSNELELMSKNLNEIFAGLSEQLNAISLSAREFGIHINSLVHKKLLSNGGENFIMGYQCLNRKGKKVLIDYMVSLLRAPDYIDKNEIKKESLERIIKKLGDCQDSFK